MFDKLIKLVRQEKVSLFIGSGFSIEAGIPSVPVLKKLILDEIENDKLRKEHENDNLDTLSEFFVNESCAGSRNELSCVRLLICDGSNDKTIAAVEIGERIQCHSRQCRLTCSAEDICGI